MLPNLELWRLSRCPRNMRNSNKCSRFGYDIEVMVGAEDEEKTLLCTCIRRVPHATAVKRKSNGTQYVGRVTLGRSKGVLEQTCVFRRGRGLNSAQDEEIRLQIYCLQARDMPHGSSICGTREYSTTHNGSSAWHSASEDCARRLPRNTIDGNDEERSRSLFLLDEDHVDRHRARSDCYY